MKRLQVELDDVSNKFLGPAVALLATAAASDAAAA
jgi:hypothetical protein